MSQRRKAHDRVWLREGAGFGASKGEWGTILAQPKTKKYPCFLGCGDRDCQEWNDVELDSGRIAYHVSECEMFDGPVFGESNT